MSRLTLSKIFNLSKSQFSLQSKDSKVELQTAWENYLTSLTLLNTHTHAKIVIIYDTQVCGKRTL